MGVTQRDKLGRNATGKRDDAFDFEVAEDPMMSLAGRFLGEQPEKEEHISCTDTLPLQMRLRRPALSEQACAISKEHGIVMTQVLRAKGAAARARRMIAQAKLAVSGCTRPPSGNRQAYRAASDDRRRATTGGAVETLAREDNPHV